jgi:hypothetical protein
VKIMAENNRNNVSMKTAKENNGNMKKKWQ